MKKRDLVLVILACTAPALACSKTDSNGGASTATTPPPAVSSVAPTPATATAADTAAAKEGGHGKRGGPASMFIKAAENVGLKDDKKASLDKLDTQVKTDESAPAPAVKDEMKALHTDLVTQVKAGKIDEPALDAHFTALAKDMQARQDKEADALNQLHGLLDTTQRKAVTADIRSKQAEREAKMEKHDDKAKNDDTAKADWNKKRLDHMTTELGLDDAQQKKVQAILAKDDGKGADMHADMKKKMDSLLTAFEGDTFDAKKQDALSGASAGMKAMMTKETAFITQLVPILKPDQREKLATKLEKRATHAQGRMGPGGPGGMPMMPPLFLEEPHDEEPAAKP